MTRRGHLQGEVRRHEAPCCRARLRPGERCRCVHRWKAPDEDAQVLEAQWLRNTREARKRGYDA
jgi:hypothetical protein